MFTLTNQKFKLILIIQQIDFIVKDIFMKNYCLQLYSVKNALDEDYDATLKAISDMGYDGVEFAGNYGGYTGKELCEKLDFYGLTPVSAHLGFEELQNNFDYHAEILKDAGCKMIVCPWAEPKTIEEAENLGEELIKLAEKCLMRGFEFGYHNHSHEFDITNENGNNAFDIMMDISDPLVLTELDLGWIAKAGKNPDEYIRKYAGRVTYLHLKQFNENGEIVTLKNGIVNIESAIKTGVLMGCEYFIVEQDNPEEDELSDAKANIEFLKSLKV